ncbi:MAG: ABC transporter ATP-binding protein [Hydrogenophaga sp.]|nr:ABC transporter ATP-binding protein [Hydrogenophaga sp.]
MGESPALQVRGLTTRFVTPHGNITAVDGVSFSVTRGETLGLVGESGSGKSVTAMSIMRLVAPPGRITAGSVLLNGTELLSLDEDAMRQRRGTEVGMVFQNPMTALNPVYSVGWQMREVLRAHGQLMDVDARIHDALAAVGMPDPARQAAAFPHQMSGGMRQRVVIAMGMLHRPQLLIADEPTTALDVTIQAQVLALMKRLTYERGTALLLITHNMGVIARMCDRVAVMYAGEIVEEAPVDELFARPRHPYTQGLLRSIPRADQTRGQLPSLAGAPPDMTRPPSGCRFRDRCDQARAGCETHPELYELAPGHRARCWIAQDMAAAVENPNDR